MLRPGLYPDWREVSDRPEDGWRWPHFSPRELACKCGRHCRGEYYHDPVFLDRMEAVRTIMGRPLKGNSWRRCALHNAKVGGASASQHRLKIGVDIDVAAWPAAMRKSLLRAAHVLGFGGIGYGRNFLHLDARPLKANGMPAQWDYQKGGMAAWLAL